MSASVSSRELFEVSSTTGCVRASTRPSSGVNVISAQVKQIEYGTYVDPASMEVERDYVLDPHDPHLSVSVPPGFSESAANRSWLIFTHCS